MKYEYAPDIQQKMEDFSKVLFPHVKIERVKCFRSHGSSSRNTIARCHTIGKLMQKAMDVKAFYALEFLSKRFDKLSEEDQDKTIIHELDNKAEIVIVDGAPGVSPEAQTIIDAVDFVLPITTPDLAAMSDARKTINMARELNKHVLGIIVNRVRGEEHEFHYLFLHFFASNFRFCGECYCRIC